MASKSTDVRPKITLACAGVQGTQLHHQEEPAQRPRPHGAEEVLPALQRAHRCTARPADPLASAAGPLTEGRRWHGPGPRGSHLRADAGVRGRQREDPPVRDRHRRRQPRLPRRRRGAGPRLPGLVAPPTFVFLVTLAASQAAISDPGLGLDYSRVVHGDQRFSYTRPLVAGDRIRTTATLDALRSVAATHGHAPGARSTDESGEPVVATWSTLVARGTAARRPGDALDDAVAVGDDAPAAACAPRRVDLVRYAGASDDFNPIHWNERIATSVGLPDVIAHGMLTMATAARIVTDWAGDPAAVLEYGVRSPAGGRARRRRGRDRGGHGHRHREARRPAGRASTSSPPSRARRCSARRRPSSSSP